MNIIEQIQKDFITHVSTRYNIAPEVLTNITVSLNTDADKQPFGDLSSNAALVLAKVVGANPRSIAQEIAAQFTHTSIEKIEIAGPGFLNIFFKQDVFKAIVLDLNAQKEQFFMLDSNTPKKHYSVEFVSANPTGPLHLGHGRGGIIGDVLGNILRAIGHTVTKEFYINDAGAQIEKLGESFKIRYLQLCGQNVEIPEHGYQGEYLKVLAEQFKRENSEDLSDKPASFFGEYAKNKLLAAVQETLTKYGINFDVWFSEKSLYSGQNTVEDALEILKKRGFLYQTDDGAIWFKSTEFGDDKDRVLKKSNGEYTYAASDIAYLQNKLKRGAEHLIIVLGQDHHSYVTRLKSFMSALGYGPENLDVILYQLVTIKEHGEQVRLSKRAGKIVSLEDITETVGTDIARFFYLHRKADAHLDFDLGLALTQTDENPVYYAQYAYVRTGSILEKSQTHSELIGRTNSDIDGLGQNEQLLIKKIISLKELLHNISTNLHTHLLTYYVLELAQVFHHYYRENRVIDLQNVRTSRARLLLIEQVRLTFDFCFKLLEINRPESM